MPSRGRLMLESAAVFLAISLIAFGMSFTLDHAAAAIARVVAFVFLLVAVVSLALDVMQRRAPRRPDPG